MQHKILPEAGETTKTGLTKVMITSSPPTQIRSYKIDLNDISTCKKLKSDTHSSVYSGFWRNIQPIAIKLKGTSAGSARNLISEFKIRGRLPPNCPNVVPFLGGSIAYEHPYVVTTYLSNGSLRSLLKHSNTLDWLTSINIMKDITIGLGAIHEHKIIHRDLKSDNIFIDDKLRAYVGDFGAARECNWGNHYQSSTDSRACGTTGYIAPESYQQKLYSAKSDIYSLGVILWEMVTQADRPLGQVHQKLSYQEAEAITIGDQERDPIPKNTPAGIAKLIRWCWEKQPENRPTETQILASLDECLTELKNKRL
jgi:serine/threonine protein kinase